MLSSISRHLVASTSPAAAVIVEQAEVEDYTRLVGEEEKALLAVAQCTPVVRQLGVAEAERASAAF